MTFPSRPRTTSTALAVRDGRRAKVMRSPSWLRTRSRWRALRGAPPLALGFAHADSRHARRVGLPATGRTLRAPAVGRSGQTAAAVLRATLHARRRGARLEVPARELARPRRRRAHWTAWIAGACDERVLERAHLRA